MKRVFIIHGWEGYPKEGWFPWLKKELEQRGFEVMVPGMPETSRPKMGKWLPRIAELVGVPDENTYLVGHSIGANAVLRYVASLNSQKVGGVVLVAPYFGQVVLEEGEAKKIANPWLQTPLDFSKVKNATPNTAVIFSDNDEWVPLENREFFEKNLSPEIIIEHNKGHINGEADITELPSALEAILNFSRK